MHREWNVSTDLEADAIPEISRLFKRFEVDHGFSHAEVFNQLEKKEFHKKVYLIHERFEPLIRKFELKVKQLNEFHRAHNISFQKTETTTRLRMIIQAECMELPFLIRILNFILRKFDNEKAAASRKDKGITKADFKKAMRVKKKRLALRKLLKKIINQKERSFNVTTRVRHKSDTFFVLLQTENFKIGLHHKDIKFLINSAKETIPLFLNIIEETIAKSIKREAT